MADNLLLHHIIYKSKYKNLKEFSQACHEYFLQNRLHNWLPTSNSLYVRLTDNLCGDSQTIFNTKKNEIRNQYLIKTIGELLFLHPSEVVYLANKKIDKAQQINDIQNQIDVAKKRLFHHDQNQQIQILLEIIQNLNQLIYLK